MKPRRHVGGCDRRQQPGIMTDRIRPERLAHVGIDVDTHAGPQNWNRTANSACRDGALMLGSNAFGCPKSGRPVGSLPSVMLGWGVLKFARLNTLKSCAISSRRWALPIWRNFDIRMSIFANVGQSTCVTGVKPFVA